MRRLLAASMVLFSVVVLAEETLGVGYVLGSSNPFDFDDPDVNRLLRNAANECYRTGECSNIDGDQYIIRNDETGSVAAWGWTGWGWRDHLGDMHGMPCGPLDCDDPPIGHSDPF